MKKIDNYTKKFSLSKTLRFKLIPMGKTEEFFEKNYLKGDIERANDYSIVKDYFDRYHKTFIEKVLKTAHLDDTLLEEYYNAINNKEGNEQIDEIKNKLRLEISNMFISNEFKDEYNQMFGVEMITKLLPTILSEEELELESKFSKFTTYFAGFNKNRENIYSSDNKHSTIAYRLIDENLPKFLNNINAYKKIVSKIDNQLISFLNQSMDAYNSSTAMLEDIKGFNNVLSQSGIDSYNTLIGGYSLEDGTKIKGLNEIVNLYNQNHEKKDRLPLLTPLFKQVLSDRESVDFVGSFNADEEVIAEIQDNYQMIAPAISKLGELINDIDLYKDGIGIAIDSVADYSNSIFGSWDFIINGFVSLYGTSKLSKKKTLEEIEGEYKDIFKKRKVYLITELEEYAAANNSDIKGDFISFIKEVFTNCINKFNEKYQLFNCYKINTDLNKDDKYISIIKDYLDSIKDLERIIKSLGVTNLDATMNETFYSSLIDVFETIHLIDRLYNKVRNFVTKKPYSESMIKLNFDNPQFLGGWDRNKERDYRSILLKDNDFYYLGVIDKNDTKIFLDYPENPNEYYEKMEYKLLPGPNKMLPKVFFAQSNIEKYDPSGDIYKLYQKGTFKKGKLFNINDLWELIDFYKKAISIHPDWKEFGFSFKDTRDYQDISQFYNDISEQGYSIRFVNVAKDYVDSLVSEGKLYLFKIYNKDFSAYSKGNPNLHTMYFKMCFDKENLNDVVYKLNGSCEMFYRQASLSYDKPTHPANQPITNKNPNNKKKDSTFSYDLIKDKRYTENQFFLHMPITMNYKQKSAYSGFNNEVREEIKKSEHNYIIGIDRGERNLIYLCVIDEKGNIVEQESLNRIISGNNYVVDYHQMLDSKEKERQASRQNWKTVNNIKEIKEGYLSQVVHKICEYVLKYDALISLENLNSGFKNSRIKVEKQVYDKFEKMLTDKLSYLVLKNNDKLAPGGVLNAYQLTSPNIKNNSIQNGIIFHIPAWLTSKIDPVTGFANLLKIKYKNIESSKEFISRFDSIEYNMNMNYFEFSFKYSNFGNTPDFKNEWVVCTYGERILTFRNKDKNSQWDNKEINLTAEFKNLFNDYSISICSDLKNQIMSQTEKDFFIRLFNLLKLTLQMRNSITGNVEVDYIISPVQDKDGNFYDSRNDYINLPMDADANGAYNIARKLLMIVNRIKDSDDVSKTDMTITNSQWLEFVQRDE